MSELKQEATPSPMVYTPQAPAQQSAQTPEYVLVEDVTGKPAPKRGPQVLTAVRQNEKKEQIKIQFKVPFPPKLTCKKCFGRGYLGFDIRTDNIVPCRKCYPMQ
jgi:hypothetical protein